MFLCLFRSFNGNVFDLALYKQYNIVDDGLLLDNHGCIYMNDQLVIHYTVTTATCPTGTMETEIF